MNQMFLMITDDKVTLDYQLAEILKKKKDCEVIQYDLLEVPIDQLIEDLDTYNFLSKQKIIIGYHATFLGSEKNKSTVEHHLEKLEKYVESPSDDNILILINDTLDKRKKLVSLLCKKMTIIEKISERNIHDLIKQHLEDYQMDSSSEKLLLEYCQNDIERVLQEIEKLKLYRLAEKKITEQDIKDIVMKSLDDNIFHLVDSILTGNKKDAFELYRNFLLYGEQVVNIIRLLANKIRLIYQVKILYHNRYSDLDMSKLLKVHEYPIKLARQASNRYSEETLLAYLFRLAKLDLEIKSGETNGLVEFEMLLATI